VYKTTIPTNNFCILCTNHVFGVNEALNAVNEDVNWCERKFSKKNFYI